VGNYEESASIANIYPARIIQTCLDAAYNSLLVAFGFGIEDTWTISIYEAQRAADYDKVILRCVAHKRKIECHLSDARAWTEGVGFVGISYSMGNENIVSDICAPEFGNIFNLKSNARDYDAKRYRSMVAVPIVIGAAATPWGMAVVTSDKAGHFSTKSANGLTTAEPIRAIAAMSALAVKLVEVSARATTPQMEVGERERGPPPRSNGEAGQDISP
jgi:hypothetical protein